MAKGTFGERLKRERELREVPLNEIASATRIAPKFLEALENEQWEKLPGGVFGRGFVRTIARYLGLSEENLLSEYDMARGEVSSNDPQKPEERIPAPPKWIPALAVLLLLAAVAGLIFGGRYAWRRYKARRDAKRTSAIVRISVEIGRRGIYAMLPELNRREVPPRGSSGSSGTITGSTPDPRPTTGGITRP
jgi:cytoskeletal protein RodZ